VPLFEPEAVLHVRQQESGTSLKSDADHTQSSAAILIAFTFFSILIATRRGYSPERATYMTVYPFFITFCVVFLDGCVIGIVGGRRPRLLSAFNDNAQAIGKLLCFCFNDDQDGDHNMHCLRPQGTYHRGGHNGDNRNNDEENNIGMDQ
jgi:hypothetical protein